jgi:hypothetical protein
MRLGGIEALNFYQNVERGNFHFAYVNSSRNYIINKVDNLFTTVQKAIMFANKEQFVIHRADQTCQSETNTDVPSIVEQLNEFAHVNYPKQKFLQIVFKILAKNELINDEMFFVNFSNIHLADFCSFINNRFDKKENTNMTKLCKYIQSKLLKFPNICIKNPLAKKYLC